MYTKKIYENHRWKGSTFFLLKNQDSDILSVINGLGSIQRVSLLIGFYLPNSLVPTCTNYSWVFSYTT